MWVILGVIGGVYGILMVVLIIAGFCGVDNTTAEEDEEQIRELSHGN